MNLEKLQGAKNLFLVALGVDIAVTSLVVISDFWSVGILKDIKHGLTTADQSTIINMKFWDSFAKLMLLTILGVGLSLIRWLNACYSYAKESIGASGFKNEGWTATGWIVPIFNLFKPYQVINEIYKAGCSTYSLPSGWKGESASGLLLAWWIFWAVSHVIGWMVGKQLLSNASRNDMTLEQSISAIELHAWISLMFMIVSVLWVIVANKLTRRLVDRKIISDGSLMQRKSIEVTHKAQMALQSPKRLTAEQSNNDLPEGSRSASTFDASADTIIIPLPQHSAMTVSEKPINSELLTEEDYWATAMAEIEGGQRRPGIWAKAFAESEGDETKSRVAYLKARVMQLINEANTHQAKLEAVRQEEAEIAKAATLARNEAVNNAISKFAKNKDISNEQLALIVNYADKRYLVSLCDVKGDTLLHACAQREMAAEVMFLLSAGADPNRTNNAALRPEFMTSNTLIRQICNGLKLSLDQLELLIHPPYGLCPSCEDVLQLADHTCPQCKAMFGPLSTWKIRVLDDVQLLAELKSRYLKGRKPTPNQIKYLVAASITDTSLVSLNDQQSYGATLLHWCARFNLIVEGRLLLESGADAGAKTSDNKMPYEWCKTNDFRALFEVAAPGKSA
ncbi:MAG: DUF4328 domain-containing protein [Polaromonas sp.]|nr:DUF4328 domain-containing protein [Polaromonas sp.]